MRKAITTFVSPASRELAIGFAVLAFFLGAGRFLMFSGTMWNLMGLAAAALIAAVAARRVDGVRALDVPARTWFPGAMIVHVLAAAALAGIATLAMWASYGHNPWYTHYDAFLVTNGAGAPFIDTNGEPYLVEGAGTDPSTWALTFLLLLVSFLAAAAVGTAFGVAVATWGPASAAAVAIAGLAVAFASVTAASAGDLRLPDPALYSLVWSVPLAIAAAGFSWVASTRIEP